MSFIQREIDRLRGAILTSEGDKRDQLYAAQQALSWALDPACFKTPYCLVTGTPADSADCLEHRDRSPS